MNGTASTRWTVLDARGLLGRAVSEERVDRRQPDIARRDEVVPGTLQMLEEIQHLRRAEIIQIQLAHGSCPAVRHKAEEEHEAVSIAQDGMRTAPSNAGEMIRKESTERARLGIRPGGVHRAPPMPDGVISAPQASANRVLAAAARGSTNCR